MFDKLVQELRSWTDGPKFVLLHSAKHLDLLHVMPDPMALRFSSITTTHEYLSKFFTKESGTFFLVVEEEEHRAAQQIKDLFEDLDIRIFSY